ncbi:hypothetical protein BHM03_00034270 [Ensete ventricosum]|nr:hypothetical protein BHM03_00034270 [Ensete ventricosum]
MGLSPLIIRRHPINPKGLEIDSTPMDLPGKRRPPEEDDDLEAEAIKRQRISDGEEDEEGGGEEGTDGAALPGLAVYKDDDDEEEEGAGRREHWMGQEIGRGETIENGGGQVRVSAEDAEVMEEFHQKDASRPPAPVRQQRQVERRRDCPYLDTVNLLHLDENRQWSRALDGSNYLPGMGELEVMKEIQKKPLIEKNDHDDEGNKASLFASKSFRFSAGYLVINACTKAAVRG